MAGVNDTVAGGTKQLQAGLPRDKSVAEALAEGYQRLREENYNEAKAIYQHVLPGDDRAAADVGARAILGGA